MASRTFTDHESVNAALQSLLDTFEADFKSRNHNSNRSEQQPLSYDTRDLFRFIDGLKDISMLVYDPSVKAYLPFDRDWIKDKIYLTLKRQMVDRDGKR